MTDTHVMGSLLLTEESVRATDFGVYLEPERIVNVVPRGRVGGLFGALATAVRRPSDPRVLPDTKICDIRSRRPMFDYDPDLALALDARIA